MEFCFTLGNYRAEASKIAASNYFCFPLNKTPLTLRVWPSKNGVYLACEKRTTNKILVVQFQIKLVDEKGTDFWVFPKTTHFYSPWTALDIGYEGEHMPKLKVFDEYLEKNAGTLRIKIKISMSVEFVRLLSPLPPQPKPLLWTPPPPPTSDPQAKATTTNTHC